MPEPVNKISRQHGRQGTGSVDPINDPNRYACKYVQLEVESVREMATRSSLSSAIENMMDIALKTLSQSERFSDYWREIPFTTNNLSVKSPSRLSIQPMAGHRRCRNESN